MRQKRVLSHIQEKYIAFLTMLKEKQFDGESLKYLVQINKINKSVIKAMRELGIIEYKNDNLYKWITDDNFNKIALELLNYLLELNKKQIVTPIAGLDAETKGYLKAIHDHLIHSATKQDNPIQGLKQPLLSKALNQVQQSAGNNLFSQVETKQSQKFELLKAVAGGWYAQYDPITPFEILNDSILKATDDLYDKFFNSKH